MMLVDTSPSKWRFGERICAWRKSKGSAGRCRNHPQWWAVPVAFFAAVAWRLCNWGWWRGLPLRGLASKRSSRIGPKPPTRQEPLPLLDYSRPWTPWSLSQYYYPILSSSPLQVAVLDIENMRRGTNDCPCHMKHIAIVVDASSEQTSLTRPYRASFICGERKNVEDVDTMEERSGARGGDDAFHHGRKQ